MTKILLIRHGDTDFVDEALAGHIDSPINDEGVIQSLRVAEALKHLSINAIYASPLKRTQETAQPLAKLLKLDVKINQELNQVNFGDWQGLSFDELIQDLNWRIFQENPALAKIPGGEDGLMVRERVSTAIVKLISQHPQDGIIAIFSHGSIVRHTISHLIGLPLENLNQIRIAPASISTVAISGEKGRLLHLNQELPVNW
ncbi:MAG: histidine phosphatase family protein, partial [Anaerolineaceae bacterium]|nr:histidine phosphatase family protein [Anaerolineaceae bacterium]